MSFFGKPVSNSVAALADQMRSRGAIVSFEDGEISGLTFSGTSPDKTIAHAMRQCPALADVTLSSCYLPDELFSVIVGMPRLCSLALREITTDSGCLDFGNTSGSLNRLDISHSAVERLVGITQAVSSLQFVDISFTGCTTKDILELCEVCQLNSLSLCHTAVDDRACSGLLKQTQLQTLRVGGCQITSSGLRQIEDLKFLEVLHAGALPLQDSDIRFVAHFQGLRFLELSNTLVTSQIASTVMQLPSLLSLGLGNTTVDDAFIWGIVDHSKLMDIDIRGTKVSKSGIAQLRRMQSLVNLVSDE